MRSSMSGMFAPLRVRRSALGFGRLAQAPMCVLSRCFRRRHSRSGSNISSVTSRVTRGGMRRAVFADKPIASISNAQSWRSTSERGGI